MLFIEKNVVYILLSRTVCMQVGLARERFRCFSGVGYFWLYAGRGDSQDT